MSDYDLAKLLSERMRAVAREVFQEAAHVYIEQPHETNEASTKLREQLALIRAKEHVTVKEAALLLSCGS